MYVNNVKLTGLTASFSQVWSSDVDANNCVDGSTNGQICHSRGPDPWLVINLHGQPFPGHIKVYNAGYDRANGARISTCNDFNCNSIVWSGILQGDQNIYDFDSTPVLPTMDPTLSPTIQPLPSVSPTLAPTLSPTGLPL